MPERAEIEPVHLMEDAETGDRFLIYSTESGAQLELKYEGDTLWMTQPQIADLFGVSRQAVNSHLVNIYEEQELDRAATCKEILQVRDEGGREVNRKTLLHNLDAIIAVGYRVSSKQGTVFRRWATDKLVQFATKGFVVDVSRLKQPEAHDRIRELREIIRDLRSDEANLYREVRTICKMCSDYEPTSEAAKEFYARMQAKIVWSVTTHTPAELIMSRANAEHPNMGLRTWTKEEVKKADVTVSKNYLVEPEIRELNRLTSILLDVLEDQLDRGRLTTMVQLDDALDTQIRSMGRNLLTGGGVVKRAAADQHAAEQYRIFDDRRKALRHAQADAAMAALKAADKALPKSRKKP